MNEIVNFFKKLDPPKDGWSAFQSKLEPKKKSISVRWVLLPATACAFAFIFSLMSVESNSVFVREAVASDLLFSAFLEEKPQIEITVNQAPMFALKTYETESVVAYQIK